MVFSNLIFLYLFLPVCLIAYFFCPGIRAKNAVLILFSLIFYAWGEPVYLLLMIASAAVNWYFGLLIERRRKKIFLILALVLDLGCLAVFKYAGFFVENLNAVFGASIPVPQIALPIGISFYTFQALSYTVDVWRGDVPAQRSFAKLLLYISLFPQLIAGPIVRYSDVAAQIDDRQFDASEAFYGATRFCIGLAKKVLLADAAGKVASQILDGSLASNTTVAAWLGILLYTFEIYFDFSGYSDMAIGMGRIFGYVAERIIETQEEADAARYDTQSRGYRRSDRRQIAGRKDIGDYEWKDRPGSTRMDGRQIINAEDQFLLGYALPHSTGGIGNTFRYRNWTLNVYMDYALGHSVRNDMQMRYFQSTMGNCNYNLVNEVKKCWSQPGDDTRYARFTANDPDWGNRNFSRMSDVFVEKGDYLCIRDISLSYKLPVRWTSRLGMKDVTLTVSGNTLYYWTAVHGVSPEAATTGGLYTASSTYDTGFSPYPPTRKVLFTAKLTF